MTKADFTKKASKWTARLMNSLLAYQIPAAAYDPLAYVPGDDEAMDDVSVEVLDAGHPLYVESQRDPLALLVNLSDTKLDVPSTCVFGSIHVVPDVSRGVIQLAGICTPYLAPKDLNDLSKRVLGSRLVRAQDECDREGVRMIIRRTRAGRSTLTVESELSIDALKYKVDPGTGDGWQRPYKELTDFAAKLVSVSNALQGPATTQSREGCYIATAVYGSYDASEVLVLRRFRDERLSKTAVGRAIIRFYYRISPAMADHLRTSPFVQRPVKTALDRVVARLG